MRSLLTVGNLIRIFKIPAIGEGTIEVIVGLQFIEVGEWKGFYADGLLCGVWNGPPLLDTDFFVVSFPGQPHQNLKHWSNPGDPPEQSHVPPHAGNTCHWFAAWSQVPGDVPTLEATFTVVLKVIHEGGSVDEYTRQVRLRIAGGPLKIDIKQKADEKIFTKHYAYIEQGNPQTPPQEIVEGAYPWYITDFDYNPFHYRNSPIYTISGLQRVNVFKAKPLWQQPNNVTVKYAVNGTGTFVNQNLELEELSNGKPDPKNTWFLLPNREALITMNGDMDSTDEYFVYSMYFDGEPKEPPYPLPVAVDDSGSFYHLQDQLNSTLYQKGFKYAYFKPHKPSNPMADQSNLLDDEQEPDPPTGMIGDWFIYQLQDTEGDGMPGVWISERFIGYLEDSEGNVIGNELPSDFQISYLKTVTQRKGFNDWFLKSPPTFDGLFKDYDWMRYYPQSPPLTFLHEYWAATDKAARKLLDYAWRIIPETDPPIKKYLGIFVGSFNMVFTDSTVTHDPGPRYSSDGPP